METLTAQSILSDNLIFRDRNERVSLYEAVQNTYFKLNGIVLSESVTKCNISKTILSKEHGGAILLECLVSNLINEGGLDNLKDIVSFLNKIESVTQRLILKINSVGEIEAISNKSELLNNWNNLKLYLKEDMLFNKLPIENQNLILKQGDLEYGESYPYHLGIKNSLLYYNLVYPFYGLSLSEENKHASFSTERFSSIIKHIKIPLDNDAVYYESINAGKEIRVQSKQKKHVDLGALEKELKKNYPNFPGKIQSYVNTISHNYELESDTNKIINSKIILHEKIDDAFEVNIEHSLKLVSDE
jgi:hypothetical protein